MCEPGVQMFETRAVKSAWYSRVQWGSMLALAVALVMEIIGTSTLIGSGAAGQIGLAGFAVTAVGLALAPLVLLGLWRPWIGGAAVLVDAMVFSLALFGMHGWKIAGRVGLPVLAMVALVAGTAVVKHGVKGLTRAAPREEMRATLLAACALLTGYAALLFAAMQQEPAILLMPLLALGVGFWRPQVGAASGLVLAVIAHFLRTLSPAPEAVVTLALYWPLLSVAVLMGFVWLSTREGNKVTEVVTKCD
jgi:hypothetical protein